MTSIASQITAILPLDTTVIAWGQVPKEEQERLSRSFSGKSPHCLVYPSDSTALSSLVRFAKENRLSLLVAGQGSKLDWGGLVKSPDILVSTKKLNRIIDHARGDLTITVEAGLKLADLQAFLASSGQFLPLDPSYAENATIGGIMATADAGTWRQRYGGVRDLILGFSFIRHDGEIAKAGGRVVKNVAGYDLMKLFTGSYGTLGIINQITLRLYPQTTNSETLIITGNSENISKLSQVIRQSALTPTVAEYLSPQMTQALGLGENAALLLRFETIPASINEQSQQVRDLGQQLDCVTNSYRDNEEVSLWQRYRKTIDNFGQETDFFCKIGLLPSNLGIVIDKINGLASINLSSGVGKVILKSPENLDKIRSLCSANQGYLTVLTAPKSVKEKIEPWGYTGNAITMMKTLKNKFDPQAIFNPERFLNKI
jgi:glycolate oxidase FAD binding subunit